MLMIVDVYVCVGIYIYEWYGATNLAYTGWDNRKHCSSSQKARILVAVLLLSV